MTEQELRAKDPSFDRNMRIIDESMARIREITLEIARIDAKQMPIANYDSVLAAIPEDGWIRRMDLSVKFADPLEAGAVLYKIWVDGLVREDRDDDGYLVYRRLTVEEIEAQGGNNES